MFHDDDFPIFKKGREICDVVCLIGDLIHEQ